MTISDYKKLYSLKCPIDQIDNREAGIVYLYYICYINSFKYFGAILMSVQAAADSSQMPKHKLYPCKPVVD